MSLEQVAPKLNQSFQSTIEDDDTELGGNDGAETGEFWSVWMDQKWMHYPTSPH